MLRYKFKYSIESVESMMRWELAIEFDMIISDLTKEIEKQNQK